jgi:hypothetical protein
MRAHAPEKRRDDWVTPRYIFVGIGEAFDLDVAPAALGVGYVPTDRYMKGDGLTQDWHGFVWMNPPFGHQSTKERWLSRFFEHGNGIALLPDRTSAPWWQKFAPRASAICFVSPKVKFERPDGTRGEQPGDGTCLLGAGAQAKRALFRCGLGVTL